MVEPDVHVIRIHNHGAYIHNAYDWAKEHCASLQYIQLVSNKVDLDKSSLVDLTMIVDFTFSNDRDAMWFALTWI